MQYHPNLPCKKLQILSNKIKMLPFLLVIFFLIFCNTINAQTFTEQTGTNNPLDGVDVGDRSSPSFVDIDGDGDKDAFIGGKLGNIIYYQNTGTTLAPTFTVQTGASNPFNTVDVGDNSIPCFVDIDGDGDMDVFIGKFQGYLNYYKNTGTVLAPIFVEQTGASNPFNGVYFNSYTSPSFVDIDGDGDMDAFIGGFYGSLKYYKNTGTALVPTFTVQTASNNPFNSASVGSLSTPNFVDVDEDGDMDAFIGELYGTLKYYQNTGSALTPTFTVQTGASNPFDGVDVGGNSIPSFADIDGDGDMDTFIGESLGTIKYYQNSSSLHSASFSENTGSGNPFNGVDVGINSAPSFVDIDGDGDTDAFIGNTYGTLRYYLNSGTALAPLFTEQTGSNNPFNGVDVVNNSTPCFVDIDGDGDMDAFIGNSVGVLKYYLNSGTALAPIFTEQTGSNNPFNSVSVGYAAAPRFVDIDGDGDMDAFIGESLGTLIYYLNSGTAIAPAFIEQTGKSNPFYGVDVGSNSVPSFIDLDGDGDMDVFIGYSLGRLKYYQNLGTALVPAFAEQTGASNPFNNVYIGNNTSPYFVDLDGDGDRDAFIGTVLGTIKTYADGTNALPVQLLTFTALLQNGSIILNWNTATEVNDYGFYMERTSTPLSPRTLNGAEVWKTIGFIEGHGNSNSPNNYSFIDNNVGSGKYLYRLKQIDFDGNFEYSDIIEVKILFEDKFELLQNFPNPFNPSTSFEFFIPNLSKVTIKIYDIRGSEVRTLLIEQMKSGVHNAFWDGRNNRGQLSSSGVYYYRLIATGERNNFTETKKMILLR